MTQTTAIFKFVTFTFKVLLILNALLLLLLLEDIGFYCNTVRFVQLIISPQVACE